VGGSALVCRPSFQYPYVISPGLAVRDEPLLVALDAATVLSCVAVSHLVSAKKIIAVGDVGFFRHRPSNKIKP
jgi:hypothetical protein